ncbi:FecR family protein [candidate division KSB1 bacterium]|nr:FecR family protein [candidate division KSB1 bacterium]
MQKLFLIFCLLALHTMAGAGFSNAKDGASDAKPAAAPSAVEKDIALVLKTIGQVQVNTANGAWQDAPKGTRLHAGMQLRTGNESLAAVVFTDDKSLLKVRSNSQVAINGKRETPASAGGRIAKTIAMQFGELWAKVTKGTAPFRVETPSGVAAVKGTIFYAILTDDGKFIIVCLDGLVELINQFGSVLVKAGETGISSPDQAPESHPTTPGEMPNWANDSEGNGDMEIEFQDGNGQKKKLKIRYQ